MTRRLDGVAAVLFDVNGTLVHIRTDEHLEEIYRSVGHFLSYQGVDLRRDQVREEYFSRLKRQKCESTEAHPEFDAVQIWRSIIDDFGTDYTRALPAQRRAELPAAVAEIFRGVSRKKLKLYPHVRHVLNRLRERYPLAIVTDAQSAYARAELHKVRILDYFDSIIVSGDHGFRKPDSRLFEYALAGLNVTPAQSVYVGNDMFRDVHGAQAAGMRTVMFESSQGDKHYQECEPDFRISDHRELLRLLGM